MNTILGELGKNPKFCEYIKTIESKKSPIAISGLTDVGMTQMISATREFAKRPILVITYNEIQAQKILKDIKYFTDKVYYLPKKEIVTYDYVAESKDLPYERIETLNKMQEMRTGVVITTIEAVLQKMISKKALYKNTLNFKVGDSENLETIKQKLVELGYVRCDLIEGRGQFSVRGGIVDISVNEKEGVRLEFWGDEIDSIRYFNVVSQRSTENIDKITIYPAHEYILESNIEDVITNIRNTIYSEKLQETIEQDIELIKAGNYISKIDRYLNSFYTEQDTILDYITDKYLVFLDEQSKIEQRTINVNKDSQNIIQLLIDKEKIVPEALKNICNFNQFEDKLNDKQIIYVEKLDNEVKIQAEKYKWIYKERNFSKSEIEILFKELLKAQEEKKRIYILAETKEKAKKICSLLNEKEIINKYEENLNQTIIVKNTESLVTVSVGKLSSGFECFDTNQLVITSQELIEGEKRKTYKSSAFKEGEKVVYADLKIGDYVVHKNYGIGIFIGVNTITADGTTKDYIKLKYYGDDVLYVPTNQLDSVRKYVGGDEGGLKVNKLGTKEWLNTKAKVKKNLRQVAKELIELYAKREKSKGYAFPADTPWQTQFEDSFPYQETDDQLRCIDEVKKDMENSKPMDRLLCGDVGYGKTEVAIRAAFKAVMGGKQVAYLAPTTVLAEQQYKEFKERMTNFGIRVEVLNRFKTKKQQTEIINKLKLGEVDIVVGTHRILSKDVEFKDLGLLIIDEEHRFGVKDKEKIKQYKTNVDVLTMTATPIPRTLALILYGDLDISIIDELPPNRKKIETFAVTKEMTERVNTFVKKQIDEGRQAYIVCPLVEENEELGLKSVIELEEKYKNETFSNYKVAYLHGKMKAKEKDEIMEQFKNGEIQILISTTVIEVGVNVPNASIMVVENAERFGLAQLHQLRGRVGRGEYQSYCILKFEGNGKTTKERMKVMCQTNDGFIISEKDLELRGSGDFFGTEQHGIPEFKIANLFEDMGTLKKVQKIAMEIMEDDPLLEKEKNIKLNELVKEKFSSRIEI